VTSLLETIGTRQPLACPWFFVHWGLDALRPSPTPIKHPPIKHKTMSSSPLELDTSDSGPAALAQTSAFTLSPDMLMTKVEEYDHAAASFVIDEMKIEDLSPERVKKAWDDEGKTAEDYLRNIKVSVARWVKEGGRVMYKLGVKSKLSLAGRLCAVGGRGLQCFPREIRALLASPYYWDVDMKNAQPMILMQLCKRKGWACNYLQDYCLTRDHLLKEIMARIGCSRDVAKAHCTGIVFGMGNVRAEASGLPSFFTNQLQPELGKLRELAWGDAEYSSLRRLCTRNFKAGKSPKSSLLALVCQTIERNCLLALERALGSVSRELCTYIHDGGLVRKLEGESEFPPELLRMCEDRVFQETGYNVQLAVKPMTTQQRPATRIKCCCYSPAWCCGAEGGYPAW
jgi:hypothetical protein